MQKQTFTGSQMIHQNEQVKLFLQHFSLLKVQNGKINKQTNQKTVQAKTVFFVITTSNHLIYLSIYVHILIHSISGLG